MRPDRRPSRWPFLVAFWSLPAALTILQMFAAAHAGSGPMPPLGATVPAALEWLVWVPLTPVVLALHRRHPLTGRRWWRALWIHLPAIGVASALRAAVYLGATVVFVPDRVATDLLPYLQRITLGWLPIAAVVYAAILAFGAVVDLAEQTRRAELDALRAHLHPHFLFNALHAVSNLVRAGESAGAVKVIADLSGLLRESLRRDGPDEISLADEIDFTRRYLDIVAIRFRDRMTVDWRVEPHLTEARVPRMILQPLVENAIRHGIGVVSDAGRVGIEVRRGGDVLHLIVTDDGPGPARAPAPGGSGLATMRARVRHLHGDRASVSLERASPRGAVATLTLPFVSGAR